MQSLCISRLLVLGYLHIKPETEYWWGRGRGDQRGSQQALNGPAWQHRESGNSPPRRTGLGVGGLEAVTSARQSDCCLELPCLRDRNQSCLKKQLIAAPDRKCGAKHQRHQRGRKLWKFLGSRGKGRGVHLEDSISQNQTSRTLIQTGNGVPVVVQWKRI